MMKTTVTTLALAALLLVPGAVMAQDEAPIYIWINFMKAKAGQSEALTRVMIEEDSKSFDGLVDSGKSLDWGIGLPVFHDGGDTYSHVEWITFAGWAGADAFMNTFMEMQRTMSAEDRAAMQEKFEATVVEGSHRDEIWEVVHAGPTESRAAYLNLGYYTAKPGKMGDAKQFYADGVAPVYDELLASGTINGYGLAAPAVHRGGSYTHMGWYKSNDLATRDTVSAAFEAAGAARSEEENKARGEKGKEIFESNGHEDQVLLIVHHYLGGGE